MPAPTNTGPVQLALRKWLFMVFYRVINFNFWYKNIHKLAQACASAKCSERKSSRPPARCRLGTLQARRGGTRIGTNCSLVFPGGNANRNTTGLCCTAAGLCSSSRSYSGLRSYSRFYSPSYSPIARNWVCTCCLYREGIVYKQRADTYMYILICNARERETEKHIGNALG